MDPKECRFLAFYNRELLFLVCGRCLASDPKYLNSPIGRFEKLNLPVGDFLFSGKLWTRVVQFYSLLCNGDEKPLLGSSFVIRCCSTIYTNFISEGHVIQSQRKTERKRGF